MPRHLGPSLILLATLVATLWLGPSVVRRAAWSHTETQLTTVRDSLATDTDLTLLSNAFERVAQVVEPSVVHIQVFHRKTPGGNWFNRYDPAAPSGNGSGWIYRHFSSNNNNADYEDVILTNHHVVDGAGRIVVRLADGREHDATLLASDQATDMAVLRLPTAGPLHAAALSLNPVAKGQIVFAFGSPLAFDFSVSQGIVSASGRQLSLDSSGRYESYIQTDAAINPGNSGGPLTDIHGRVVGMNFAIASDPGPDSPHNSPHTLRPSTPSRGFLGLGFAIPVNIRRASGRPNDRRRPSQSRLPRGVHRRPGPQHGQSLGPPRQHPRRADFAPTHPRPRPRRRPIARRHRHRRRQPTRHHRRRTALPRVHLPARRIHQP